MSLYTCPDCKDGVLEAKVRELELEDGETAQLVNGHVFITTVGCNNGCESADDDAPSPEECGVNECARPKGHDGRHRRLS
jgi:hypothetical protein